jgi:hypothetical protein
MAVGVIKETSGNQFENLAKSRNMPPGLDINVDIPMS